MTRGASQPSAARSGSCWYSTPWMVSLLHRCTYELPGRSFQAAGSGSEVWPSASLLAAMATSAYLRASPADFLDQAPLTTTSTAPPGRSRDRFSGTMAFSASPPPCMNRMRNCAGTASSVRRSASAVSAIEMNSLPRWLISITLMPEPCQSSISAAAWRSTSSGSTAGPAEKL